jgi:hypothetical protein
MMDVAGDDVIATGDVDVLLSSAVSFGLERGGKWAAPIAMLERCCRSDDEG